MLQFRRPTSIGIVYSLFGTEILLANLCQLGCSSWASEGYLIQEAQWGVSFRWRDSSVERLLDGEALQWRYSSAERPFSGETFQMLRPPNARITSFGSQKRSASTLILMSSNFIPFSCLTLQHSWLPLGKFAKRLQKAKSSVSKLARFSLICLNWSHFFTVWWKAGGRAFSRALAISQQDKTVNEFWKWTVVCLMGSSKRFFWSLSARHAVDCDFQSLGLTSQVLWTRLDSRLWSVAWWHSTSYKFTSLWRLPVTRCYPAWHTDCLSHTQKLYKFSFTKRFLHNAAMIKGERERERLLI